RRLLLVIPTLFGIMLVNFALVQFVPGGPVEQVLANLEGEGNVFASFDGTGGDGGAANQGGGESDSDYLGARGLPEEFIQQLEEEFGLD
ncbi:MAG: microcin ABC transporter permease, partial [Pseudomonadota bacterium]